MKNRVLAIFSLPGLAFLFGAGVAIGISRNAHALELDWSGQFWSEFNFVHNYSMDGSDQGVGTDSRVGQGGYYVPGGGSHDAAFQSLFLRLRPKLIVNDNIYIKSEWWVGDPIFGLFGNGVPYSTDQRQFYLSQSRGSVLSAQRYWGEFVTDVGTVQVGRVPLHWGLGLVWNSGDNLFDRYMSTGDAIRWNAKFGAFSFIPSVIINSSGNTIGGSCTVTGGVCNPGLGTGNVVDYSLIFKYENTEDDIEAGINVVKRLGGANQDPNSGVLTSPQTTSLTGAGGMNFMTYDIYAKKKFGRVSLGAEVPIIAGSMSAGSYQTFGVASEVDWKPTEVWDFLFKLGYAPGQGNSTTSRTDSFQAFYFNPNYRVGMVMFNYQLANFAGPQTLNNPSLSPTQLSSPYNNPIVNAAYAAFTTQIKPWEKWTFRPGFVYAQALQTATDGQFFYNYWTRTVQQAKAGKNQDASLGFEIDLGVTFQWDEYFTFMVDNGLFFPGGFYAFSNVAGVDNATSPVFATSVRIGVNF